jgi:hypothetical protein
MVYVPEGAVPFPDRDSLVVNVPRSVSDCIDQHHLLIATGVELPPPPPQAVNNATDAAATAYLKIFTVYPLG